MKTPSNGRISSAQDTLRQASGRSVHYVAHLTIGGSVRRYATRAFVLGGNAYLAEIVALGGLERSLGEGRDLLGLVDATNLVFSNYRTADATEGRSAGTVEALHNLYRLEGAPVKVGMLFDDSGADEDDIIWLVSLVVDDVATRDDPPTITLRCVDSTLASGEQPVGRLVDDVTFPESLKQARGKMIPIVYGSVRNAPLIPIDIGFTGNIDGSLLFNETTVYVTDIEDFPENGSAWIEDEVIRWTSRDTTNAALTDVFRGEQSTTATDHPDGATLAEYKTGDERYRFAVADHACDSVDNVRAGGKIKTAGAGDDEYVSTTLADPYGQGRDIQVVEFKRPPKYSQTSAYSRALPIIQEPDEEEQQFTWSKGGDDNLGAIDGGDYDGTNYADLCIDQTIPRIGAALQGDKNHLQLQLDTDLSDGALGSIRRARVKCEYFTASEETHGAAIRVKHDGTEIASAPLAAATPEDLATTGSGHDHAINTDRSAVLAMDTVDVGVPKTWQAVAYEVNVTQTGSSSTTEHTLGALNGDQSGVVTNLQCVLTNIEPYAPTTSASATFYLGGHEYSDGYDGPPDSPITAGDLAGAYVRVFRAGPDGTYRAMFAVSLYADVVSTPDRITPTGNIGGNSEVSSLEDIAASSSLAIQTVPFTYALDQYVTDNALADRWAVFDGTLDLDVQATGTIPDGSSDTDDRIYVTRLWIEIELREASIVLDWNGLTANVEGVTRSSALLQNPVDLLRYVIISPDTANGVPDFGYMGLAQSAIDSTTADRAAYRLNAGNVSGYPDLPAYTFNRRIDQPTSALTLIASICRDCHLRVFREGETFQFHVVDIGMQSPVATLDSSNVFDVRSKSQTGTACVANEVTIRHNANYAYAFGAALGYDSSITASDDTSQAMSWGTRSISFTAPWLTNQASTANAPIDLATWWATFLGFKWTRVVVECTPEVVDLERHDCVTLDLPYQGLPGLIGRVVNLRHSALDAIEVEVEVPQYSSRCYSSGYQNANNMFWKSAGNQALSLRLAGIEATYWTKAIWNAPTILGGDFDARSTGAAEIVDAYEPATFPAYAYINYKKTADADWTAAIKITAQYGTPKYLIEIAPHLVLYSDYGAALDGETAYDQCVYCDQTEGSTTISLGGEVVCKITSTATATLPAYGVFVYGKVGAPDTGHGGLIR